MKHTTPFCHPCNTDVLSVFAIAGFGPFEPCLELGLFGQLKMLVKIRCGFLGKITANEL